MYEKDPRKAFERKLRSLGEENENIVSISCDSAKGAGMSSFAKEFPNRHFEVGISEQTAISMSAGLAEVGYIPVIAAITPFLTMRAYEQVRNDIGYAKMNVKIFGSGAGLAYSTLGSSHAVTEDIAVMSTIPNLTILNPGDGDEVEAAMELSVSHEGPVYIRVPRQAQKQIFAKPIKYAMGKSNTVKEGDEVLILATGTMVNVAKDAAEILEKNGLSTAVEAFLTVKPLDEKALINLCSDYSLVFTLEEHSIHGGFGSLVSEILMKHKANQFVEIIGIESNEISGPYLELLDAHGLSPAKVATRIKNAMKGIQNTLKTKVI